MRRQTSSSRRVGGRAGATSSSGGNVATRGFTSFQLLKLVGRILINMQVRQNQEKNIAYNRDNGKISGDKGFKNECVTSAKDISPVAEEYFPELLAFSSDSGQLSGNFDDLTKGDSASFHNGRGVNAFRAIEGSQFGDMVEGMRDSLYDFIQGGLGWLTNQRSWPCGKLVDGELTENQGSTLGDVLGATGYELPAKNVTFAQRLAGFKAVWAITSRDAEPGAPVRKVGNTPFEKKIASKAQALAIIRRTNGFNTGKLKTVVGGFAISSKSGDWSRMLSGYGRYGKDKRTAILEMSDVEFRTLMRDLYDSNDGFLQSVWDALSSSSVNTLISGAEIARPKMTGTNGKLQGKWVWKDDADSEQAPEEVGDNDAVAAGDFTKWVTEELFMQYLNAPVDAEDIDVSTKKKSSAQPKGLLGPGDKLVRTFTASKPAAMIPTLKAVSQRKFNIDALVALAGKLGLESVTADTLPETAEALIKDTVYQLYKARADAGNPSAIKVLAAVFGLTGTKANAAGIAVQVNAQHGLATEGVACRDGDKMYTVAQKERIAMASGERVKAANCDVVNNAVKGPKDLSSGRRGASLRSAPRSGQRSGARQASSGTRGRALPAPTKAAGKAERDATPPRRSTRPTAAALTGQGVVKTEAKQAESAARASLRRSQEAVVAAEQAVLETQDVVDVADRFPTNPNPVQRSLSPTRRSAVQFQRPGTAPSQFEYVDVPKAGSRPTSVVGSRPRRTARTTAAALTGRQ